MLGIYLALLSTLSTVPLDAKNPDPKIVIYTRSSNFQRSYELQLPSPLFLEKLEPSQLTVKISSGRLHTQAKNCHHIGPFFVEARFNLNKKPVNIQGFSHTCRGHFFNTNIKKSSIWYSPLEELLSKVTLYHYPLEVSQGTEHSEILTVKSFSFPRVKSVKNYKLDTSYYLDTFTGAGRGYHRKESIFVDISTRRKQYKKAGNKTLISSIATFSVLRKGHLHKCLLEFIKDGNSLKEIRRRNIKSSSFWYSTAKKLIRLNINKYIQLQELEKRLLNEIINNS